MWGRKKGKTDQAATDTPIARTTAKLDHTVVSSGKVAGRRLSWRKLSKRQRLIALAGLVVAVALVITTALVLFDVLTNKPADTQPTEEEATTQMLADFYKRREEQEKQPTPEIQLDSQFKTYEDKIKNNQAGDDDNQRFETYSQAAFIGAKVQKPQAADYAKKALEYTAGMDQQTKEASAGIIKSLEIVAKGDYSAFTQ